ncbi:MAG: helix-turn-helix transcriptional regulator [Chloroflexi bacterium]|jgi:AcrR family transcriptional regulator|nr:helix-turn-helix transcriptional regulator [Chloroflexota bacterium]
MVKREERNARITQQRRREIVNAALAVFAQKGYAFATVDDIAREANVAVGTLYKYYKNKRDILMAVLSGQGLNQSFIKEALIKAPKVSFWACCC